MIESSVSDAAAEPRQRVRPGAVIDIGATSIRMAIAEIDETGRVHRLESLSQAASLGKDTFTSGILSRATIEDCVRVLRSYRQVLREYQISDPSQVRVVATSAVREARNSLAFLDRVYIATGLNVEPLDEAEVNRVTYMGLQPYLESDPALKESQSIVVEVGGGSTELLLVKQGNVVFAHTYRLGSLRLRKALESLRAPAAKLREVMEQQIDNVVSQILERLPEGGDVQMIALGGDVRFAIRHIQPDWDRSQKTRLPVESLEELTGRLLRLSPDSIAHKFHLSFPEAETVGPALLAYARLARALRLDNILVTNTNLRDGLLQELAAPASWSEEFRAQILRSAVNLGRKYEFDEMHGSHVADLASKLFTAMQEEHQLDRRFEVLLSVAALLHAIGNYVSNRSMHKHSMYLIRNSELFGLGRRDLLLVSLIARYHRRASPQPMHEGYSTLGRDDRVAVAKLAGILRVAIALDDSRSRRIRQLFCRTVDNRLVISIPDVDDLSLEQLALKQSGSLFEETYGLQVELRRMR
ncbi:MAG: HD domain-containing protein [Pirellulaceae bacterium]|nr:HD domain-containing protein [Pirellulaceae bacterium]